MIKHLAKMICARRGVGTRHRACASRRRKQRGYSLLEIAIVGTISLSMIAWLAVKYYNAEHSQRDEEAKQAIVAIQEAVIAYAADHSAPSRILVNMSADATVQTNYLIPNGRPYLPCPDITGDGLEDRRAFAAVGTTINVGGSSNSLDDYGDCYRQKGILPWRTLGVQPKDPWGNLYTYRVGQNFSNGGVGFDQYTRAAQGTYTGNLSNITIKASSPDIANFDTQGVFLTRDIAHHGNRQVTRARPGSGDIAAVWSGDISSDYAPSIVCPSAPCSAAASVLIVGDVLTVGLTVNTGGYDVGGEPVLSVYDADDIVDGAAVVIVSHGRNGNGAMYIRDSKLRCRHIPTGANDEAQNAFWAFGDESKVDCSNLSNVFSALSAAGGRQNGFVFRTRSDSDSKVGQPFDDVIGWISPNELVEELETRGAFPAPLLPPVGAEELP